MNEKIIGVSTAFTGNYKSSKLLIRFLELLDINIIKSTITNSEIIEAGSTIASADYCLPLRAYIGHIYCLLKKHPEINYIVAPIIKSEHFDSSTCAKYRDLDGVIIRSLGNITGYRLTQSRFREADNFNKLIGIEKTNELVGKAERFPIILAPEIESTEYKHLRQVCFQLYAELFGLNKIKFLAEMDLARNSKIINLKVEKAFKQAHFEIFEQELEVYENLISSKYKPRLALVGRSYLVDDPLLSSNIKSYYQKRGVVVLTSQDIPFSKIKEDFDKVDGFYDSHKLAQAFINVVFNDVDGFIAIGSFGCHPDAFLLDYLAKDITKRGKSCWIFKYDEQSGGIGYETRYETILSFLENKRDERLNKAAFNFGKQTKVVKIEKSKSINEAEPIFIWPHMGYGIDLILKEIWYQLGLSNYLYPPKPVYEETILKGSKHYSETCSPFALYIGSLCETLEQLFKKLENDAISKSGVVEPKRIIILMAKGKGPCTFGWYSIAGNSVLNEEFSNVLDKYGHTLEMILVDNQGRDMVLFLKEIVGVAKNNKLSQIIKILEQVNETTNLIKIARLEIKMIKKLKEVVWTGWEKLLAYEELQNKALVVRAHELEKGITTKILKKWIHELDIVHTLKEILDVKQLGLTQLDSIPKDNDLKPKVVIVGEIYGTLTPFANRGTVDNLLGKYGIEGIEGMRLSNFILGSFKSLKYSFIQTQPIIRALIKSLEKRGIYHPNKWVREPYARPFIEHEVGGDGQPTVARARLHVENDGVDGVLHIYPFKCMPEGIAKDALKEIGHIYGVKCLHLSYDKEIEVERLKTEIGTFSVILNQDLEFRKGNLESVNKEIYRRQSIGKVIDRIYQKSTR
ncbi:MAG: acyl-CoA dehydratase activase-related protein [Vulcanibacillus sp.]